jgi:glycosyltransferase involved in cell wall biosynthesis
LNLPPGPTRLFMTTDAVGGVWTYALDLAAGLGLRGFEVVLAVLGPAPSLAQRAEAGRVAGLKLIETHLPLDWTAANEDQVRAAGFWLADLAHGEGAELIHLNSPALAAGRAFKAPVVGACHSCLGTWWDAVRGGDPPYDFRWRIRLLSEGYAACDALVAPSRAFAEATRRRYGVLPRVVRNGRGPVAVEPAASRRRVAITAGRLWDEGKGLETLEAAARIASTPIEAAGPVDGPLGQRVAFEATTALGRLGAEALAGRLAESLVFVSPSLYEPFGLSVLEAAAAGCALVLSDIPTFRELWEGAALFVPPRDAPALAAAIDRLAADDAARTRLAAAARTRARTYGIDPMAEGTAALYRQVLARSRAATTEAVA